ncbi:MAG: hypothetical protein AAB255_05160 [Bacteroidota bacterium]
MSKVLLTIQFQIKEGEAQSVESIFSRLKDHFETENEIDYNVFEVKGKPNSFIEIYSFENLDEYNKFNESDDQVYEGLGMALSNFIEGSQKSSLLIQKI